MLKLVEFVRPNGRQVEHVYEGHCEFFENNNIGISFEFDNVGSLIFYCTLRDYHVDDDPLELIKIVSRENISIAAALAECQSLCEDYISDVSVEQYIEQQKG